jgi:peptidoglycan/xylan/chitin deacetylase (PgdA/CDA1 family)
MAEHPIAGKRWLAKKGARLAVGTAGRIAASKGVRVLTYHRFGPSRRMPFTVTAQAFDREMAFLARTGRAITLDAFERHLTGETPLPDGSVLVTIDDGDPSVLHVALPILQRHAVPAVLYALAGTPDGFEVLAPAELRAVAEGGVTIGSHTMTHRSMAQLPPEQARREAVESKARLEDTVGHAVTSFAYPFGTRRDVSAEAADLLREAGYRTGFTSLHGAVTAASGKDAMLLPRIKVESGDPAWLFPALCGGAMDRWRLIDSGLSALQKPQKA